MPIPDNCLQSIQRIVLLLLLGCVNSAVLAISGVINLPTSLNPIYDLAWMLQVNGAATLPVEVLIEQTAAGQGYRLTMTPSQWRWQGLDRRQDVTTGGWLGLESGRRYAITLKRRAGVVGVLVDHRLIDPATAALYGDAAWNPG
jgi:hypothetical protein